MDRTVPFLNACISFVAFITAFSLVVYMLVSFVTGTYDVAIQIFDTVFLTPAERQGILNGLNVEFLHTIALLIVLMKAYRVLVEYMRWYHIDIKYMMEIGIIASVLELLFNYQNYSTDMRYIFLGIAVSFSTIYAFRHDVLVAAMKESRTENFQWRREGKLHMADLEAEFMEETPTESSAVVTGEELKEEKVVAPAKNRRAVAKPKAVVKKIAIKKTAARKVAVKKRATKKA